MFRNPLFKSIDVLFTPLVMMANTVSALASSCGDTVTVRTSDTLSHITSRCGVTVNEILRANRNITNPDLIHPGQIIHIG